uniref:Uncharacterized protein n=4 Tax=Candidatus Kentrum eta TaxID=2126337 RepID=A0A450VKR6_9GAMM|nr:MAG: hypothetical protein BECKH772C_GA0070978_102586 [Candidatus Kentron sp. H]
MDFTKSIAILIPSIFTTTMTNRFTAVAPFRYTIVDVAFVRIYQDSSHNRRGNRRENTCLLYVRQHLNRNLPTTFNHPKYGWLSLSQESLAHEPLSDGYLDLYALFSSELRLSLVTCYHVELITLDLFTKFSLRFASDNSLAQLFGHLLNITRIRVEFVSNPAVGQI